MESVEDLRQALAGVPEIVTRETGATVLPFPLSLVEGITEEDVNLIYEASGRLSTKYNARWETFLKVNLRFVEEKRVEEKRQKQAEKIQSRMKLFMDKGVPSAPLLLIPARTFLLLREENQKWITRVAEQAEKELKEAMKQSENEEKSLEKVRDLIGEEVYRTGIEKARREREGPSVKDILKRYGTYTYRGGAIPDFVYWAREGLVKLTKAKGGWYRAALKKLLEAWEIPDTDDALRQRKSRKENEK